MARWLVSVIVEEPDLTDRGASDIVDDAMLDVMDKQREADAQHPDLSYEIHSVQPA